MKNQQKPSSPPLRPLPRRPRLRHLLTGGRYEAVKMPRPGGDRGSREGTLAEQETVQTPVIQPGETPRGTSVVRTLNGLKQTPPPLNRVPTNGRAGVPARPGLGQAPVPFDGRGGGPDATPSAADRQRWKPGTLGFNDEGDDPDFEKFATVPMMVLRGISI